MFRGLTFLGHSVVRRACGPSAVAELLVRLEIDCSLIWRRMRTVQKRAFSLNDTKTEKTRKSHFGAEQ